MEISRHGSNQVAFKSDWEKLSAKVDLLIRLATFSSKDMVHSMAIGNINRAHNMAKRQTEIQNQFNQSRAAYLARFNAPATI